MSVNKNKKISWTQLTNRTPSRESLRRIKSSLHSESTQKLEETIEKKIQSLPITLQTDRNMRDSAYLDGTISSWGDVMEQFNQYLDDKEDLTHILRNKSNGEKIYIQNNHRFEKSYEKKHMAKSYAIERKSKEHYENPKTVMITLSASIYQDNGNILPPVDHLDSIVDPDVGSWGTVKTAISRILKDFDYEYMRILEPHTPDKGEYTTAGYAHQHIGLIVDDPNDQLDRDMFKPAIDSHIKNCDTAGREAHKITDDKYSSVSIFEEDPNKDGSLGSYLTAYLGKKLDSKPQEAESYYKRFMSLLWVSNRRRMSFSNGANEWVKEDYEEKFEEDEEDQKEKPECLKTTKEKEQEIKDKAGINDFEYYGIGFKQDNGDIEEHEVEAKQSGSYTSTLRDHIGDSQDWQDRDIDISHYWTNPP